MIRGLTEALKLVLCLEKDVIKQAIENILDRYSVDPSDKERLTELALKILTLTKEESHSPSELRDLVIELALENARSNV